MLTLYTYENRKPDDNQIRALIKGEKNYTYLTATKALSHERIKLIPEQQEFNNSIGILQKQALFIDVLRNWTMSVFPVASRGEEKTTFLRTVNYVAASNEALKNILIKDISTWLRVLDNLARDGYDAQRLPLYLKDRLVNQSLEGLLANLHSAHCQQLILTKKELFGQAVRKFLDNHFVPANVVVMEGFTYLTNLQEYFVDLCNSKGVHVIFIVPYSAQQDKGFMVVNKTYGIYGSRLSRKTLLTKHVSNHLDLRYVQSNLFANSINKSVPPVKHIHMCRYPNRDREIVACIDQLRLWFESGDYCPRDVVVVMRFSNEFIERLHDYIVMNPLYYISKDVKGKETRKTVELYVSPRLLLLTPVGRFVLTLYNIWDGDRLKLEVDQLETILASGWLGAAVQDTTPIFRAIKHQYFSLCVSKEDWISELDKLHNACVLKYTNNRLPIVMLKQFMVEKWRNVILLVDSVCRNLFSVGQGSIATHIRQLLDELDRLMPKDIRRSEKIVLERIKQVFHDLGKIYSINLTTEEFGEAIHALTRNDRDDLDHEESDMEEEQKHDGILKVTTPEAIDGITKKCIIYVGVDNQHVPALYSEPWPFYDDKRDEHLDRERYMFLTVIRSVEEELVITCAKKDGDRSFQPSIYIGLIEKLIDREIEKKTILDSLDFNNVPGNGDDVSPLPVFKKKYDLSELAHYGLCPLRYRLEKLHPEAKIYRSDWQLEVAAQGIWLERVYSLLQKYTGKWPDQQPERLPVFFNNAMKIVEGEVRKLFPAFTAITWHSIRKRVSNQLKYHAEKRKKYRIRILEGYADSMTLFTADERLIAVDLLIPYMLRSGYYDYPLLDSISCAEWLLPGDNQDKDLEMADIGHIKLFRNLDQAVSWWQKTIKAFDINKTGSESNHLYVLSLKKHFTGVSGMLLQWINGIEQNCFPRNVGKHCTKCPVRLECLGIPTEEIE